MNMNKKLSLHHILTTNGITCVASMYYLQLTTMEDTTSFTSKESREKVGWIKRYTFNKPALLILDILLILLKEKCFALQL